MKKILTLGFSLTGMLLLSDCIAQSAVSTIKANSYAVKGETKFLQGFEQDPEQRKDLLYLFEEDVFYLNNLREFDTELKQKVFMRTAEYQKLLSETRKLKAIIKSRTYYIDYEPDQHQRKNLSYDLKTKTFSVYNTFKASDYDHNFYNKPGLTQFDFFLIPTPSGITLKNSYIENYNGKISGEQKINFRIPNEETALKIENESMSLRVLYVFNITNLTPYRTVDFFGKEYIEQFFQTKLQKVLLYNADTEEVYAVYKPAPPQPSKPTPATPKTINTTAKKN